MDMAFKEWANSNQYNEFFNILVPQRILDQHTVQYFKLVEKLPVSHNTAM